MVIHILRWAFDERRTSCVSRKQTNLMNFSKEDFKQQPQQKQRETKKSYNEDIFIYLYTPPPHTHSHTKKNVNRKMDNHIDYI